MAAEAPIPPSRRGRAIQRYARTIPGIARATTKPIPLAPLPPPPPPLAALEPRLGPSPRVPLFSSRPPASSEPTIEVHDTIVDPIDPLDAADGAEVPLHFRETEPEPAPTIEVREVEMGVDELELPPTRSVGTWEPLGAAATTMSLDEGELVAGRYRLSQSLGIGGMGGVWSAFDEHLRREVVVKVMSGALRGDGEARRRFEQEAHALSLVASHHIVHMHDHGVVGDSPFIVLERLHGEDLAQRLERVGHLSLVETEVVLRQLASGIDAAHERKIVHRDIKPANIFIAMQRDGVYASEVVKILDFGVAKLIGQGTGQTRSGITVGSPQFMSPEQVQGLSNIDTRSDLFALGAVIYMCLTGKLPFAGEDLGETFLRICTATFVPPSEIWQTLPRGMDAFFRKAFSVDPERRFNSATEMWSVFKAIVDAGTERTQAVATLPPEAELPDPVVLPSTRRGVARFALAAVTAVAALVVSIAVVDALVAEPAPAAVDAQVP